MFEFDEERVFVGGVDADLGEVGQRALVVGAGVLDRPQEVRELRPEFGGEHTPPTVDEVGCHERRAVAPDRLGPQVERVRQPVGRRVPTLGYPGHGMEVMVIVVDERLVEGAHDVGLGDAGDDLGVEFARLAAVAQVQDAVAVALFDGCEGLRTRTAGEESHRRE